MSMLAALGLTIVGLVLVGGFLAARLLGVRRRLDQLVAAIDASSDADTSGDPEAALEAALAAARDERAAAELERVRLAGALDAHGDGVIVVDERADVVLCNEAGRRYHGARFTDAIVEAAIRELLSAALAGEVSERVLPLFGPPERVVALLARPIEDEGRIVGAAAVVRDVTDAIRVDRVRRDFAAAVSHELKTPIGALVVLAETMADSDDPVVMAQLADRVSTEAVRLGSIIDDLLDLAMIEAQERPRREPVPVQLLVHEAYDLVYPSAREAQVPVEIGPIPAEVDISCDRAQVVSAIRNLLENAVKYSEPGELVEVGARRDGDSVVITVRDHGIGVPMQDLERIFERFYRVDKARARRTGGTGLGLAIVRHVAAAHGGEVTVESVEGEGSRFELHLPHCTPIAATDPMPLRRGA